MRPNYFISIPIRDNLINDKLFQLTCDLLDTNPRIEKYLFPDTAFHLTLCTLRIDSDEDLNIVKKILDKVFKSEKIKDEFPIELDFQGIGEFYDKVLYVKSKNKNDTDKLDYIKNEILKELRDNSINIAGNYYEFVPHLTIVKIQKDSGDSKDSITHMLPPAFWERFESCHFGKQDVKTIQLCQMGNINVTRKYIVDHTITL